MKYLIALSVSLALVALALCQDFGSMAVTIKQATDRVKEKMQDRGYADAFQNNFNDLPPAQAQIAKAIYVYTQEAADKSIFELVHQGGSTSNGKNSFGNHNYDNPSPPKPTMPDEDMVYVGGFAYQRFAVTTASVEYNEYRAKEEARCQKHQAPQDYLYGEFWEKMVRPEARKSLADYLSGIYENTKHYNPPC
jgi:hypothetical protein